MMIDVHVADTDLNLAALYTGMNPLMAGAELTYHSRSRLVFTTAGQDSYTVTGTDLEWTRSGLVGGAIDGLALRGQGQTLISFTNLQTTGVALWAAFQAEHQGSDPTALTHMLVHHCWTYYGSAGVDYFPETTIAPFGLLNPTGNDRVHLYRGDDVFFTGSARDTVLGGAGDDQIWGGTENDLLLGGGGGDSLWGGTEDDVLSGGAGRDVLQGGDGGDRLTGGSSSDWLSGGEGADVFVFNHRSGKDIVTDFVPGQDHLLITSDRPVSVIDMGLDCQVQFGLTTVLLQGVTAAQISADDFS